MVPDRCCGPSQRVKLRNSWGAKGRAIMDPNPDYDASDEVEYFFSWLPWDLRGVYPPPSYPPV